MEKVILYSSTGMKIREWDNAELKRYDDVCSRVFQNGQEFAIIHNAGIIVTEPQPKKA